MSRFGTRVRKPEVRAWLAGGLPVLVASPGGSGCGLAMQAPGSSGSWYPIQPLLVFRVLL